MNWSTVPRRRCGTTVLLRATGSRCWLDNCWQYAVLAFATARAAVVLVPINFMLTAEEIAYILGHSQVRGVIVEA